LEADVKFVAAVADALGVRTFTIGGNSLGGQTASAYPGRVSDDRVKQLILVDAAGYPMAPQSVPMAFQIARIPGIRAVMD